ncbi:hypothetical protein TRAPUB_2574, partial [Trametes pubescens]
RANANARSNAIPHRADSGTPTPGPKKAKAPKAPPATPTRRSKRLGRNASAQPATASHVVQNSTSFITIPAAGRTKLQHIDCSGKSWSSYGGGVFRKFGRLKRQIFL